ncbi:MAG: acyloxyacyl hydrolase [Prevotella sp.]|nr:acyloxyacyl hydrolase [Prevotella sp.]
MAFPVAASAVSGDSAVVHRIEVEAIPGTILHTNDFLKGYNPEVRTMNQSFLAKLKYAFAPPENSEQALIYKGVYQGVGLAIHDFNSQLGHPVSAYIFQGATIKTLTQRMTLNYEWDFGLTYGWKAHDWQTNPENRVIGSKTTAYIDVDLYLRWMISKNWDLNIGATITHYSNGNTAIPNAGLNVLAAKASVAYYINRHQMQPKPAAIPPVEKYWFWDLTLYGAWKKKGVDTEIGAYALPGTYGVIGFTLNPLYHVNHWLNVGASLDGSYDGCANMEIAPEALTKTYWNGTDDDIYRASWYKKVALGLSARTEFVMPYFTINFGIGHNFVNAGTKDLKGFYEILALKIHLLEQAYLHIGYSLYDFYYPNNLMLGIGLHL